jgi:heme A synthase
VLAAAALARSTWRVPSARRAALLLAGTAVLQFSLGVVTLLFFHEWPVLLGSLHQLGAVALLVAAVGAAFRLERARLAPAG